MKKLLANVSCSSPLEHNNVNIFYFETVFLEIIKPNTRTSRYHEKKTTKRTRSVKLFLSLETSCPPLETEKSVTRSHLAETGCQRVTPRVFVSYGEEGAWKITMIEHRSK